MRKRVKLQHDAVRGWHVDLPTYAMIPGSCLPITATLIDKDGVLRGADVASVLALNPTVEVHCPDEYQGKQAGTLDAERIRKLYEGHPEYGKPSYTPKV